jgi:hypothetical protein
MADIQTQVAIGEGRIVGLHGRFAAHQAREKVQAYLEGELERIGRALEHPETWQVTAWNGSRQVRLPGETRSQLPST